MLRWGALLAFLGLFFMHGASASAAQAHCGGALLAGHTHQASATTHEGGDSQGSLIVASAAPTMSIASLGAPVIPAEANAGQICVAILLTGLLIFLLGRTRSRLTSTILRPVPGGPMALDEPPPPQLTQSMLSIWRN